MLESCTSPYYLVLYSSETLHAFSKKQKTFTCIKAVLVVNLYSCFKGLWQNRIYHAKAFDNLIKPISRPNRFVKLPLLEN